jgi:class 3 adenylate cyclase
VREVVARRLDHLSAECNRILCTASAIGREFELHILERVSDVDADMLELLEEAVAARVLVERPQAVGRFSFAHALIRESLYSELGLSRRVRLHGQIAGVLEDVHRANPEPHVAELAYHFFEAAAGGANAAKAIEYAVRAGRRATALLAWEEAVTQYERALLALERGDAHDETRRGELLLALGEARIRAGAREEARAAFAQAAEAARRVGAAELLARAALEFGGPWARFGRVDETVAGLLEEASRTLGDPESPLHARLLGRLAVELYYWPERASERIPLAHQAVEMARPLGDPATLAYVLSARNHCLWGAESAAERLSDVDEILRLSEQIGDRERVLEARTFRVSALLEVGDITALDREIAEHAALADAMRQPFHRWHAKLFRAMRALVDGQFEPAEPLVMDALATGQAIQSEDAMLVFGTQAALLRLEQGRIDEVLPTFRSFVELYPAIPALRCGLAAIHAEFGRREEAVVEFERVAAHRFADLPRDASWLVGLTYAALASVALGDLERAALVYDLLAPQADRNVVVGLGYAFWGPAHGYCGALAATLGRWDEAETHFEAALARCERMATRPWLANTQHRYARMLLARGRAGDRDRALTLLARALDTARALGMKRLLEQALADRLRAQGVDGTSVTSLEAVVSVVESQRPDLRAHAAPDGTVTILFTDIEDSTVMTERLGDQRAQEVLRAHHAIVRREIDAYGGFEVKSQGDGFMLAFSSAGRALKCATAIQRAVTAHFRDHPQWPLRVRCGLHTGEPIREANDFYGKSIILAARIAGAARGGEILASSLLRELTDGTGDLRFGEGRELALKGLTGTHRVYELVWQ